MSSSLAKVKPTSLNINPRTLALGEFQNLNWQSNWKLALPKYECPSKMLWRIITVYKSPKLFRDTSS